MVFVACGDTKVENQLRDKIEENGEVTQITIYYGTDDSAEESYIEDGYVVGHNILFQTETQADVERIFAMLEGWKFEENKITGDENLLLYCGVHVCFHENKILMSYPHDGTKVDGRYYGYLDGQPYYLPDELGEYIEGLLSK